MGGEGKSPHTVREYLDVFGKPHLIPSSRKPIWRPSGYVIVPGTDMSILMVVPPWDKKFHLPGGGIHLEERLAEGVIRECFEETGYRIRLTSEQPIYFCERDFYNHWHDEYCHSLAYVFTGELTSDVQDTSALNRTEIRETERVEWVPLMNLDPTTCGQFFMPITTMLRSSAWPQPHHAF